MSEEAWISSTVNLLKCLEKQATPTIQSKIHEFRRSFESGSKKQRVLYQWNDLFKTVEKMIPICYYPEKLKEQEQKVISMIPEINQDEDFDEEIRQMSSEISSEVSSETSTVAASPEPKTKEELMAMITPEMLREEEERLIRVRAQHLEQASQFAKWWNSQKFTLDWGTKSISLINAAKTEQDQKNFADALIHVFTQIKIGSVSGIACPFDYQPLFNVPLTRGGISQKKIDAAVRRMGNLSPEYTNKIRNTIPNGAMQEMANDPNLSRMISTLQGNSNAQKLAEKLAPK